MSDQDLSVTITADDGGAVAQTTAVNDLLAQMETELAKLNATGTATLEALTAGHTRAAAATTEHAAAESFLGESIGKVETATNAAARVFSALGLSTAEATERVEGLGEAFEGLEKAAVPLLAIGAAVLAAAEAFNFLKEGVDEAAKAQSELASLGTAIKDQGGTWNDAAKDGVDKFLDAIERATTYSRGEALDALNRLVSAGMDLADAERTVAVATDVAAGTHRSLIEVVDALKMAQAGHGRQLVELDENLAHLVKTHGEYSSLLTALSAQFAGQASAATETFEGRSAQLRNELAHLGEELGEHLLPMLTEGTEVLIGFAEAAEDHVPQVTKFFDSIVSGAISAINVFHDLQNALPWNVFSGNDWKKAGDAWHDLGVRTGEQSTSPTGDWKEHYLSAQDIALRRRGGDQSGSVGDLTWEHSQAPAINGSTSDVVSEILRHAEEKAKKLHDQATRDLNEVRHQPLDHDFAIGGPPHPHHAGGGPTAVQPITDDAVEKTQAWVTVQKQLDDTIKSITDSERAYKEAVLLATDSTAENAAKMALARKESQDAQREVGLLTGQVAYETNEIARQTGVRDQAEAAMHRYTAEHNALGAAVGEGTKRSLANRDALERLSKEHDAAKTAFTTAQHAIEGLTQSLAANNTKLDEARDKTHALEAANAAILRPYNDSTSTDQAKKADDLAIYGKSLEAQKTYWEDYLKTETAAHAKDAALDADWYKNKLDAENHVRDLSEKLAEDPIETATKRAQLEQQLADEANTEGKSLQQQIAYYAARYALLVGGDSLQRAEAEKYYAEILKLENDEYKQRIDAQKTFVNDAQAAETSLLDEIIAKHQSFHSIMHGIFEEIAGDFIKMVERMIVEAPLLTSVEKTIAGLFGGASGGAGGGFGGGGGGSGGANATAVGSAASLFGLTGIGLGESGASSAIAQLDTTSVASTFLGTATAQNISAATNAAAAASANANSVANATGGGSFSASPTAAQLDALGIPAVNGSDSGLGGGSALSGLGGSLGKLLQGAGIGTAAASVDGGNQTNGALGGLLGAGIGLALHANPLIGAGIDLATGLLGSLFGSHANPGQNPDEFESQTGYGQDVANLQGNQSGASGVAYFPAAQVEQFIEAMGVKPGSINGMAGAGMQSVNSNGTIASSGGVDAAEIWLAQNQKDTAQQLEAMGISPAQFAQWEQLFGVSATGSGQFSHIPGDSNIGDIEVTGATSGGNTKTNYATLAAALQSIIGAGANGGTPIFSMTEAYPGGPPILSSSPLGSVNTTTGVYTPSGTTVAGGATASGSASVTPGGSSATITHAGTPITITIGTVVGPGGIASVATELAQALQQQQSGQIPGAPGNSRAARYGLA